MAHPPATVAQGPVLGLFPHFLGNLPGRPGRGVHLWRHPSGLGVRARRRRRPHLRDRRQPDFGPRRGGVRLLRRHFRAETGDYGVAGLHDRHVFYPLFCIRPHKLLDLRADFDALRGSGTIIVTNVPVPHGPTRL